MRAYQIDFTQSEAYECGMMLVTLLAYPETENSEEMLANIHASLCNQYLQKKCDIDPEWANTPQLIKPIYSLRNEQLIRRDLRQTDRRLRDRMIAARMTIGFLKEVNSGVSPKLPTGFTQLSINAMSVLVADGKSFTDSDNIEKRIWRKSVPVIHLAAAVAILIDLTEKDLMQPADIYDLLADPDKIRWVISSAQEYAELLYQSKRLTITPDRLIQISCK
jgi:hypothetical protein